MSQWGYQQPSTDLDQLANAATQPIHYAPAAGPRRQSPSYSGIKAGSGLLTVVGALLIIVGVAALAMAALSSYGGTKDPRLSEGASTVYASALVVQGFLGASLISYGVLMIFIASIGSAIRDIARNSFR